MKRKKIKNNKNIEIAIIGAGVSGLTAAHFLKQEGYNNITIFERSHRAGGKCKSIIHDGRVYELGAVLGSSNYETIEEIINHTKSKKGKAPDHGFYDFKSEGINILIKPEEKMGLFWEQYIVYRTLLNTKYRRILSPGLDSMDKELFENMYDWANKKNLNRLAKSFTPLTPAYGYGYFDETPALYYLKYIKWPQYLNVFKKCKKYTWERGIQTMLQKLADEFNVIYKSDIRSIERKEKVHIRTEKDFYEFDKLIVSSPLDETLVFMDSTGLEQDIFSRIKTVDYRIFLCEIKGLPHNIGYMLPNVDSKKRGEPMVWYCRYEDRDIYNFYVTGDVHISDEDIIKNIEKSVGRIGGRFVDLIDKKHWKYFPHFDSKTLKAGVYDILEGMQGKRNTFYIGEIMNFSSVEYASRYSKTIVERFF